MAIEAAEFTSRCEELLMMIDVLEDEIVGPHKSASFDSLDEFSESLVNELGGDFVFSILVRRRNSEQLYNIHGSPSSEFFEVKTETNLLQTLTTNLALTQEEQRDLSSEERYHRLSNSDVDVEDIESALSEIRNAPIDIVEPRLNRSLSSQSGCEFQLIFTSSGEIARVELERKIFVDVFSISEFDEAVIAVINASKGVDSVLYELYDVDSVTPDMRR